MTEYFLVINENLVCGILLVAKLIAGESKDCQLRWELRIIVRKYKKKSCDNDQLRVLFIFKHNFGELISHPLTKLIHLCEVPGREESVTKQIKQLSRQLEIDR